MVVYTNICSVFFFDIKNKITVISFFFFLEAPSIKCDADTENILYIDN